jgi:hypothetical protein
VASRGDKGPWNYEKNGERLREFWRGGVAGTRDYEKVVTLGMRGDGDEPMGEGANVALLERIVSDQRTILAEERIRIRRCGRSTRRSRSTTSAACACPTT